MQHNSSAYLSRQLAYHRRSGSLDDESMNLLKISVNDLGLSARAHDKVLRMSRTIADIEGVDSIALHHPAKAINYRMLDRDIGK